MNYLTARACAPHSDGRPRKRAGRVGARSFYKHKLWRRHDVRVPERYARIFSSPPPRFQGSFFRHPSRQYSRLIGLLCTKMSRRLHNITHGVIPFIYSGSFPPLPPPLPVFAATTRIHKHCTTKSLFSQCLPFLSGVSFFLYFFSHKKYPCYNVDENQSVSASLYRKKTVRGVIEKQ